MIARKVMVAFEGVNRLYTYFDDEHNLSPGDVVYVEGKMWKKPGQVQEVLEAGCLDGNLYNRVLAQLDMEVHGTYHSYGPYMFCFDEQAISYAQFKSWVSPPDPQQKRTPKDGFALPLDELGYCDFVSEKTLEYGIHCFEKEQVEFLSLIDGEGLALVNNGRWITVAFECDGKTIKNITCQNDPENFCEHAVAVCLTLRTLLNLFQNEFADCYRGRQFTAVNRNLFYRIIAYSLKKITL